MKRRFQKGSTSVNILIALDDKTTGLGKTGLVPHADMIIKGYREGETTALSVTETASGVGLGVYVSGGFYEVDSTNSKGLYQFGIPDSWLAAGADSLVITFQQDADILPARVEIELTDAVPDGFGGSGTDYRRFRG